MKKYFFYLAIVALGLTACNRLDIQTHVEKVANDAQVYHVNIPASMGADTKAVTFDGTTTITSTFLATDKVYVYNVTKDAWARVGTGGADGFGYLQPSALENAGKNCSLTGDLSFYKWIADPGNWSPVVIESTDSYNLYYQAQELNSSLVFDYDTQVGTPSAVSSLDYSLALGVTMNLSDNTLALDNDVSFHNYGSMFRQRLSFTGIGSAPTTLRYLWIRKESGGQLISTNNIFSSSIESVDAISVFSGSSIMDENNDVYFALAFDETNLPTGRLLFDAADFNGNYFSGAKDIPDGGFGNGKYYYGDLGLAFNLHRDMPVVTDINSAPVWPNAYDFYIVGNGTTISGNSEDYSFYPGESGTITLTGNGTASKAVNSFVNSFIQHRGLPCDLTITLGSDYAIYCPNTDTAINMYNKGFLKLATTGGTQTLTVAVKGNTTKGLVGTNYTGTQAASALAADGFIVTLANSSPAATSDGIYTYVYTVTPVTIDLASITSNYTAIDSQVLTGTLANNVKISIADGATVTLSGVNINGSGTWTSGDYAGLTCLGDATIILADGTTNTVRGFQFQFPGIFVPGDKNNASNNKTLTIKGGTLGSGSLNASSSGNAPGIGSANGSNAERAGGNIIIQGGTINATGGNFSAGIGSSDISKCGNITISGGNVTATGGQYGAGIGSGYGGSSTHSICGDILISGGTVVATGGNNAAGIGAAWNNSDCGSVTILSSVTSVTAYKGPGAENSIGRGNLYDTNPSTCGTVTLLGTVYWDGSAYQNGGNVYLPTSPLYAHIPFGAISGKFSVDSGKQVYFSQGNLMYSDGIWNFHTHQYDMCFTTKGDTSAYHSHGTFDLFGWGTSGYQWIPDYTNGTPYSYYCDGDIAGTNHDWGKYNTISNGGTGWRTPTRNEWDYLLNQRTTTSGVRYARATVNNVAGLIILPDNWNTSYYDLSSTANNGSESFSTISISQSDWTNSLEANGAVFLPAFGYRYNTTINDNSGQILSFYWSSSKYDANDPYSVRIDYNALVIDNTFPNSGGAFVRLVKDAN